MLAGPPRVVWQGLVPPHVMWSQERARWTLMCVQLARQILFSLAFPPGATPFLRKRSSHCSLCVRHKHTQLMHNLRSLFASWVFCVTTATLMLAGAVLMAHGALPWSALTSTVLRRIW